MNEEILKEKKAIIIDCFNHYDYRIKYIADYLKIKKYQVKIYLSDYNHLTHNRNRNLYPDETISYIHVLGYKKNLSISRVVSHFTYEKKILKIIELNQPDLVFCEVPPNYLVYRIAKLKRKKKFKLIFDIIDLWPESFPKGDSHFFLFEMWRGWRNRNLQFADLVLLECDYYRNILKNVIENGKIKVLPLLKTPLQTEIIDKWKKTYIEKPKNVEIRLAYLGSINDLIDIEKICNVIEKIQIMYPVTVKIIGDGNKRNEFIQSLEKNDIKVEYFGVIFDDEKKMEIFSDCHFGINIYKETLNIGMTIKSLDYFKLGLPILNSIPGDTEIILNKYGIGINIKDMTISSIEKFYDNMLSSREMVWKMFEDLYSENAIYRYLEFLNEVL